MGELPITSHKNTPNLTRKLLTVDKQLKKVISMIPKINVVSLSTNSRRNYGPTIFF